PVFNLAIPLWNESAAARHPLVLPIRERISTIALPAAAGLLGDRAAAAVRPGKEQARRPTTARWVAGMILLGGALVGLSVLIMGLLRVIRLASLSDPVTNERWLRLAGSISREYRLARPVQLLHSHNPSILVTWGVIRPRIVLPAGACEWPEDRAAIVLRHELAHIRRWD